MNSYFIRPIRRVVGIYSPHFVHLLLLTGILWNAAGATSHSLRFLLLPTAAGVSCLLGYGFYDAGAEGYAIPQSNILIAPECAGLRFLVVSSCVGLSLSARGPTFYSNLKSVLTVALSSYILTVVANISRIVTIVFATRAIPSSTGIPAAFTHLFLGSFTYFLLLVLYAGSLGVLYRGHFKRTQIFS